VAEAAVREAGRLRLSIVVPVYNEGENIVMQLRGIAEAVHAEPYEVLVIYDFDGDTTVPVVRRLQAELPQVLLHKNELGRGVLNALKVGLAAASAPYVVVTMADLSDEPATIDQMYALAQEGAEVVAASRYMSGGRQIGGPVLKRTLSRMAGLTLHWLGDLPTHDATSNFKLYSRRFLDQIEIESVAGFELALELTVKAHLLGLRVAEVPTTWRDRSAGQSRFQMREWIPHYLRWYGWGLMARFRGGRRAAVDRPAKSNEV
jgi:dolichol-phosphate mannosyltransferase